MGERQRKKTKLLAVLKRFFKGKSKHRSNNVHLEDTGLQEAQVQAVSSPDPGMATSLIDTGAYRLDFLNVSMSSYYFAIG